MACASRLDEANAHRATPGPCTHMSFPTLFRETKVSTPPTSGWAPVMLASHRSLRNVAEAAVDMNPVTAANAS